MRAAALAAEEAGFDGVWTWDHLRDPDERAEAGVPEAWTTLTALAEATRRITLGPLVLNTGLRHPGLLANMAATLQQVSGGRLLLGIGAGATPSMPYAREQEALGMEVAGDRVRAERVAETAQVLRRLWSGDASSFAGRAVPPRPAVGLSCGRIRPRPSSWAASARAWPRSRGAYGDGFNTQAMHPDLAELGRVAREAHAASGRDPARFGAERVRGPERALAARGRAGAGAPRAGGGGPADPAGVAAVRPGD